MNDEDGYCIDVLNEEGQEEEEENCSGDEFKKKLNWILDDHESTIMEDQNNVDIEKKK